MNEQFNRTVAFAQLLLLLLWEGVGAVYFGWSPLAVFLVWLVGIFTLNICTATVLRTFIKLTQIPAPADEVELTAVPDITEDDIGG